MKQLHSTRRFYPLFTFTFCRYKQRDVLKSHITRRKTKCYWVAMHRSRIRSEDLAGRRADASRSRFLFWFLSSASTTSHSSLPGSVYIQSNPELVEKSLLGGNSVYAHYQRNEQRTKMKPEGRSQRIQDKAIERTHLATSMRELQVGIRKKGR